MVENKMISLQRATKSQHKNKFCGDFRRIKRDGEAEEKNLLI